MKTRLLIMMAATALVWAGCSNDENEGMENWNGEIRLSSGLVVQTRANNDDVPDKQIAENQMIGIYVKGVNGETGYGYNNVYARANGQGGLSHEAMYYSTTHGEVLISAYHPHNGAATDVYNFTVETDQSVESNYFKSDLLYSKEQTYNRQIAAHSLTFEHKLVKVVCELSQGNGKPDITGATVEIVKPKRTVKFDRTKGDVTTVEQIPTEQDNVKLGKYGAIIAPQNYEAGSKFLKVTTKNNSEFYYTIPKEKELELSAGHVYTYKITVNLGGLIVASTIKDWEGVDVPPTEGDAVMQ